MTLVSSSNILDSECFKPRKIVAETFRQLWSSIFAVSQEYDGLKSKSSNRVPQVSLKRLSAKQIQRFTHTRKEKRRLKIKKSRKRVISSDTDSSDEENNENVFVSATISDLFENDESCDSPELNSGSNNVDEEVMKRLKDPNNLKKVLANGTNSTSIPNKEPQKEIQFKELFHLAHEKLKSKKRVESTRVTSELPTPIKVGSQKDVSTVSTKKRKLSPRSPSKKYSKTLKTTSKSKSSSPRRKKTDDVSVSLLQPRSSTPYSSDVIGETKENIVPESQETSNLLTKRVGQCEASQHSELLVSQSLSNVLKLEEENRIKEKLGLKSLDDLKSVYNTITDVVFKLQKHKMSVEQELEVEMQKLKTKFEQKIDETKSTLKSFDEFQIELRRQIKKLDLGIMDSGESELQKSQRDNLKKKINETFQRLFVMEENSTRSGIIAADVSSSKEPVVAANTGSVSCSEPKSVPSEKKEHQTPSEKKEHQTDVNPLTIGGLTKSPVKFKFVRPKNVSQSVVSQTKSLFEVIGVNSSECQSPTAPSVLSVSKKLELNSSFGVSSATSVAVVRSIIECPKEDCSSSSVRKASDIVPTFTLIKPKMSLAANQTDVESAPSMVTLDQMVPEPPTPAPDKAIEATSKQQMAQSSKPKVMILAARNSSHLPKIRTIKEASVQCFGQNAKTQAHPSASSSTASVSSLSSEPTLSSPLNSMLGQALKEGTSEKPASSMPLANLQPKTHPYVATAVGLPAATTLHYYPSSCASSVSVTPSTVAEATSAQKYYPSSCASSVSVIPSTVAEATSAQKYYQSSGASSVSVIPSTVDEVAFTKKYRGPQRQAQPPPPQPQPRAPPSYMPPGHTANPQISIIRSVQQQQSQVSYQPVQVSNVMQVSTGHQMMAANSQQERHMQPLQQSQQQHLQLMHQQQLRPLRPQQQQLLQQHQPQHHQTLQHQPQQHPTMLVQQQQQQVPILIPNQFASAPVNQTTTAPVVRVSIPNLSTPAFSTQLRCQQMPILAPEISNTGQQNILHMRGISSSRNPSNLVSSSNADFRSISSTTMQSSQVFLPPPPQSACFICGLPGSILCCGRFVYCSAKCQDDDWLRHKDECSGQRPR